MASNGQDLFCGYCTFTGDFNNIVNHLFQCHKDKEIKYRESVLCELSGKEMLVSNMIKLIPKDINFDNIIINSNKTISMTEMTPTKTPCAKRQKLPLERADNPPVQKCLFKGDESKLGSDDFLQLEFENTEEEEIIQLIPSVLEVLRENQKISIWVKFMRLLADKKIPFENIAFVLFLDVVEFLSCENTVTMRYSGVSKRFWCLGMKLFHSKFINFMSGYKNLGSIIKKEVPFPGQCVFHPSAADINFAVPSLQVLAKESKENCVLPVKDIKPGILPPMLDMIKANSKNKAFKLCVDGQFCYMLLQNTKV